MVAELAAMGITRDLRRDAPGVGAAAGVGRGLPAWSGARAERWRDARAGRARRAGGRCGMVHLDAEDGAMVAMNGERAVGEVLGEALRECLEETFESVQGIYLDRGTSLFETLAGVSAEEASRAVAPGGATLAAQVEHVRFYLDVLDEAMRGGDVGRVDWREIWERVRGVTPAQWAEQQERLRESYRRVSATIQESTGDGGGSWVLDSLAVLAHTAYHLGGIRQALAAIRGRGGVAAPGGDGRLDEG